MSTHSRLHGSTSYRVPWLFDEEACDVLRKFVNLKCSLMPYWYAQAVQTHNSGVPMMRPMFMEFPGDRACETLDKQYMMGDNLLVAPVFKESGLVEYYVPEGKWVSLLSGDIVEGGKWHKEVHGFDSLPLLVKPNAIVVMGKSDEQVVYDYDKESIVCLSCFEDGASAEASVVDAKGNFVRKICAKRVGNEIRVSGLAAETECRLLGDQTGIVVARC